MTPLRGTSFRHDSSTRAEQDELRSSRASRTQQPRRHHHPLATYATTIAGATAGLVSSAVTCPLDVVKIRKQNSHRHDSLNTFRTLTNIWKTEGVSGFYRGLTPTVLGYLPSWSVYFTVYDYTKRYTSRNASMPATASHMVSACLAGICSTTVTSPLWVVRTRIMTQPADILVSAHRVATPHAAGVHETAQYYYKSTWDAFRTIYKSEGISAFYKGLTPSLFGVSHVIVQFPIYEYLKQKLSSLWLIPTSTTSQSTSSTIQPPTPTVILISSMVSKFIATCLTYPHEVIRTRLQTQTSSLPHPGLYPITSSAVSSLRPPLLDNTQPIIYKGGLDTLQRIIKNEGTRGLYRGLGTNLLRTVPSSAVTLGTFEAVKWLLADGDDGVDR